MEKVKGVSFLNRLTPMQVLAFGFATVILAGAILLTLPVASAQGKSTSFLTALFTATSAVCVTGLVVVDTGTYWSTFGQVVILSLIEIGGLGFMSFATLVALVLGKRITLRERLVMQEALNVFSIQGLVKLMRYVLIGSFAIEGIGAILLSIRFIPEYGMEKGIYYSIFHAISAYCNAGFDLIGNFSSLVPFQESFIVNLTVMGLIIIGGMGFLVQSEIYQHREFKKFSLHSKVVIYTTVLLIVAGAVVFFALEFSNTNTMGPLSFKGKVFASLFASVTPRTAGFNTIPTDQLTMPSKLITIILMFIGASPGSTGGGIKTTTAAMILMTVISVVRSREDTELFNKRIPKDIIYRSLSIVVVSLTLVILDILILSITEHGAQLIEVMFETASAFGTVGLSLGLTTKLSVIGRIIIILTMYAGRVGPLTLTLALAQRQQKISSGVKYPEEKVLVG